jgi:hypothetical protein
MGNPSRPELHPGVAEWGSAYRGSRGRRLDRVSTSCVAQAFDFELKQYFRLSCLSRSTSASTNLKELALQNVFRVRTAIEKSIMEEIEACANAVESKLQGALTNPMFGSSKKQGTSLRMPLTTCIPSSQCGSACYAHDVLDATPRSVIRGAMNGWIAGVFEQATAELQREILSLLIQHVNAAVRSAQRELLRLPAGFTRRAYIRFSHVGEIVHYPKFANALARAVIERSKGEVDCVVYTRHRDAALLDSELWVINFTLDPSSLNRRAWAPREARIVFSAFGGVTSTKVDVNFLEHHRWIHVAPVGDGRVCPATLPETPERTCDAVRCARCFGRPG